MSGSPLRRLRRVAVLAVLIAAGTRPLRAQDEPGLFERLNLDKLRLTALGVSVGPVAPTSIAPTTAYSVHADYGEISPRWRVVFTATYWGSHFTGETTRRLENRLREQVQDTAAAGRVSIGTISVSDIAVGGDLRWTPRAGALRPYLGGGVLAHVVNAEGKAIQGTVIENALDNIALGFAAMAGVDLTLARHLGVGLQGRFDLTSGVRYGSLRLVGTYHFDTAPGQGGR